MGQDETKAFVVTDDDGIIIATYRLEGCARRFCKDNGYSYQEYVSDYAREYWKTRCLLAEKLYEGKSDYLCDEDYFPTLAAYNKFIEENKNHENS